MSSRSGGSKECRWRGPDGATCRESRDGTKPATVKQCPSCQTRVLCRQHCGCKLTGRNAGRGASNLGVNAASVPVVVSAPSRPQQQQQQQQQPQAVVRQRSRSGEGRRYSRGVIEERLIAQWRFLSIADRPLPDPGRADSGIIGYGTWADGLKGGAKERTLELLATSAWKATREHSSVHLTLFLRWAENQVKTEAAANKLAQSTRMGGLELGRHIQGFL